MRSVDRERVVEAVERALREVVAWSTPATDDEWRADAETVADAALATMELSR